MEENEIKFYLMIQNCIRNKYCVGGYLNNEFILDCIGLVNV